jgi:hypothetical protein
MSVAVTSKHTRILDVSDSADMRISDAEREDAIEVLGEHVRTGRLDIDEFGTRSAKVNAAKTVKELAPLFEDLPSPRPSVLVHRAVGEPPATRAPVRWMNVSALPVAAVVAFGVLLLTRNFIVAAVAASVIAFFFISRRH